MSAHPLYDALWLDLDRMKASVGLKSIAQQALNCFFRGVPAGARLNGALFLRSTYAIIVIGRADRPFDRWAQFEVCQGSNIAEAFVCHETRRDQRELPSADLWKVARLLCD